MLVAASTLVLAWLLVLAVAGTAAGAKAGAGDSRVIRLSGASFEHLTQASTGATTGDWFVMFYAPWCGHCKRLSPQWDSLSLELQGEVNVAKVDAAAEGALANRFGVKGYPTLMYFHHGTMFTYAGKRDVDELADFARIILGREELPEGAEGVPVPRLPSSVQPWERMMQLEWHEMIPAIVLGGSLGYGIVWCVFRQRGSIENGDFDDIIDLPGQLADYRAKKLAEEKAEEKDKAEGKGKTKAKTPKPAESKKNA